MSNQVSPAATRWLARPEFAHVDVVWPTGAAVAAAGMASAETPTTQARAMRTPEGSVRR
jgi:hypothetical protein